MSTGYLHQLPVEVLILIVQELSITDVRNLMLACKTLNNKIKSNNPIWRHISRSRLMIQGHVKNKKPHLSWYDKCRVSSNWCKGIFRNKGLIYHDTRYMPWLEFHNSESLLLTVGSELRCYPTDKNGFPNCRSPSWSVSMPKIPRYDKRTDDISRFVLKDNLLVCGNRNGSTAVYRVDDIKSKPELIQYIKDTHIDGTIEVSDVDIVNKETSLMVTASLNSTRVYVWWWGDDDNFDLSKVSDEPAKVNSSWNLSPLLQGCFGIKCIAIDKQGEKLLIGPDGISCPIVIDMLSSQVSSYGLEDPRQIVQDVQWHDENTFCFVTHAGGLQTIDLRVGAVVYETRDPFQASFYCLKTNGQHAIIAGTNQHSRCVLYDTRKPNHAQLFFTQVRRKESPVYSLDFDSTKLIAAVDWGVSVLDFNVPSRLAAAKDYSHNYEFYGQ